MKRRIIILAMSLICMVFMSACNSSGSVDSSTDAPDNKLTVSDTLSAEHFDFSILSVTQSASVKSELGAEYTAAEGNVMVTVVFDAKNTSSETQNVANVNFNSYVDGEKVMISSVVGKVNGYMPLLGAVSSEKSFDGYAIWELPKDWKELEFSYIDSLTGSESENVFVISPSDATE